MYDQEDEKRRARIVLNLFIRGQIEEVAESMKVLFDHLPEGEIDEDEDIAYGLDEENERVVIRRGEYLYWLEWDCTVRERAGFLTYFKNGTAYTSPPPSEN